MTGKTAIDKIRSLKRNAENDMPQYDYGWDAALDKATEALAALEAEKPGEDVELDDLVVKIYESAWDWGLGEGELETLIQQFAESYHAEQCKACKALPEVEG